jgi:hypothetical protein
MTQHPFGTDATPREQREYLENERRLREQQGTTFSQFAQSEADEPRGRFSATPTANKGPNRRQRDENRC